MKVPLAYGGKRGEKLIIKVQSTGNCKRVHWWTKGNRNRSCQRVSQQVSHPFSLLISQSVSQSVSRPSI
ncbi:hypothetical protein E2C01_093148 [Portunus trituberculatus]|uniref:Uncharacterized protein n=1 Tax=Portunus trituberculatus TaxID=210409 RepID=A0A5B7JTR3_PORTR|nr:hypothetical protein [Portunus trituberculatus]